MSSSWCSSVKRRVRVCLLCLFTLPSLVCLLSCPPSILPLSPLYPDDPHVSHLCLIVPAFKPPPSESEESLLWPGFPLVSCLLSLITVTWIIDLTVLFAGLDSFVWLDSLLERKLHKWNVETFPLFVLCSALQSSLTTEKQKWWIKDLCRL